MPKLCFPGKPSLYYHLKVLFLSPGKRMIGQQKQHRRADDFGLEGSVLRAEKRFIKRRLEGSFGPLLRIAS
jgi:hypothetical protein